MRELSIDIETYSSTSLSECGLYKYVESPDFEILIFGWAFDDDEPAAVTDISRIPASVMKALTDKQIIKTAFNANFEITCLEAALKIKLDPYQWRCTMVHAMMLGLPGSLDAVGRALELDTTKDVQGKALINFFTKPCKPTKTNNFSTRNYMSEHMSKAFDFQDYCCTDVSQERLIKRALNFFTVSDEEMHVWVLDQKINNKGIAVDIEMAKSAIYVDDHYKQLCTKEAIRLTGVKNPRSIPQLKGWLEATIDEPIDSLNKKQLPKLKEIAAGTKAAPVLKLREELSKTSTKKYNAIVRGMCDDGYMRGLLQYYGASRTGRWGSRLLQIHNLKRNTEKTFGEKMIYMDMARELVKKRDIDTLTMMFESTSEVLSELIRAALVPSKGNDLICADYAAIEARITAWLAQEKWRLDVFNGHGKIYEASAAAMLKKNIKDVTKEERQRGKVSELALGFGGGPAALERMGALEMGIPKEDLKGLVSMWRKANPNIVRYWKEMNDIALEALSHPGRLFEHKSGVSFQVKHNIFWLKLPSGRCLTYYSPKIGKNKWGGKEVTYLGINQETKRWERQGTYGGKLTENIVQAIARDLLADGMVRLDRAGFNIVMHVHDEAVIDHPSKSTASAVIRINKIMAQGPEWSKGLPLSAECFVTKYYKKE